MFILASVSLVGLGRFAFFSEAIRISAWSISRTVFGFWLAGKIIKAFRVDGSQQTDYLRQPIPLLLLLFLSAVAVSLLPDFRAAGDFRYLLFACMHALMIMDLFRSRSRIRWILLLLALLPAVVTLRGIVHDPSVLSLDRMRRLGFPLDHANTAGYLFSMSIPLAAALVLAERGRLRWFGVASCAAQLLGLILTYSRGAWLGWGAAMLFLLVLTQRWKVLLCLLLVPMLFVIWVEPLRTRALSVRDPGADPAMRDRLRFMGDTLDLAYANPLGGIGYGRGRLKEALRHTYKGTADENSPIWHAHNVYIELFAETGIIGLAAFLWLLGRAYRELLRLAKRTRGPGRIWAFGLAASLTAAAASGFSDVPFYHHETRIFFFTLVALAFVSANPEKPDVASK